MKNVFKCQKSDGTLRSGRGVPVWPLTAHMLTLVFAQGFMDFEVFEVFEVFGVFEVFEVFEVLGVFEAFEVFEVFEVPSSILGP